MLLVLEILVVSSMVNHLKCIVGKATLEDFPTGVCLGEGGGGAFAYVSFQAGHDLFWKGAQHSDMTL